MFIVRLFKALFEELLLIFKLDSKFLDSPLNQEGIDQAMELRRFLQSNVHPELKSNTTTTSNSSIPKDIFEIIRGDKPGSVVVCSTLRRALSTTTIALWPRLDKSSEKIIVLSSLQEISRNIDTRALSNPKEVADLPFSRIIGCCQHSDGHLFQPEQIFDPTENFGNKTLSFTGIRRLKAFNEWIFQRNESVIIAGGHSLWFKNYFQTFMPHKSIHDAKTKKITNSGVVSFTVQYGEGSDGTDIYRVDPDSIQVLYGGFTTK